MREIRVDLKERRYPIYVGRGVLSRAGELIRRAGVPLGRALIVTQPQIRALYGLTLENALKDAGYAVDYFIPPKGRSSEAAKSEGVFMRLVHRIAALDGSNRPPVIIALGGGVVGDLAGFAAGVYRRGSAFVQVPTTLTAQVDSAIGGKTAIDLPQGKNLLGVIHQPKLVISDTATLESLSDRAFSDGAAEVIKYGVICEPSILSLMESLGLGGLRRNAKKLEDVISRSARIKAAIVARDEFDRRGDRIVLNFGHTAGHGIEAAGGYSKGYTHGEAVAIGMLVACDISETLGYLRSGTLTQRLEKLLLKFGLPLFYRGLAADSVMHAMGFDKKSEGGKNRFVLVSGPGRTHVVRDVPAAAIREALLKRKA